MQLRKSDATKLIIGFFITLFLLIALSYCAAYVAAHESHHNIDWIKKYQGKNGYNCCAKHDCRQVRTRLISVVGERGIFEIEYNGTPYTIQFPMKNYYPSEDRNDWYCFVMDNGLVGELTGTITDNGCNESVTDECANCLFIAIGS